jgi:hypothetical protein
VVPLLVSSGTFHHWLAPPAARETMRASGRAIHDPTHEEGHTMKDQALCVDYYVVHAEDRPGTGAELGKKLARESVNLLAIMAFPSGPGKTQVDLVPENPETFAKAARKLGLTTTGPKSAFLVHGSDKPGAMADVLDRLAQSGINVHASCGVGAGGNRYGAILWVAPADVEAATRALGAQIAAHHHA